MLGGIGLLLFGSGLYWIISSVLINSFTTLRPGLFENYPMGAFAVLVLGVTCLGLGTLRLRADMKILGQVLSKHGSALTLLLPILAGTDVASTSIGVSRLGEDAELNAVVASAYRSGPLAFAIFTVAYVILTLGLALLVLNPSKPFVYAKYGFPTVSSIAAFGPFANILILAGITSLGLFPAALAVVSSCVLLGFFVHLTVLRRSISR